MECLPTERLPRHRSPARLAWALAFPLLIAFCCCWYLLHSHESLVRFYKGLQPCFYGALNWESKFFTPAVKAQGNRLCLAGLALAALLAYWNLSGSASLRFGPLIRKIWAERSNRVALAIIVLSGTLLWYWGTTLTAYSCDETFSAYNFAPLPFLQTISYYAIPNNHVFFNAVNHFWSMPFGDAVLSGRLISLVFYLLLLFGNYVFLKPWVRPAPVLVLVLAALALQFPVWGFGHQARGYALYAFCEWLSFVTLFLYLRDGRKELLGLNALAQIVGAITIPSYLYWLLFQLAAAVISQLWRRRFDALYWRYMLRAGATIFCLYLPILCFSGYAAMAENPFVTGISPDALDFIHKIADLPVDLVGFCFAVGYPSMAKAAVCFLLPAAGLLMVREPRIRLFCAMYLLLLAVSFGLVVYMKRFPFVRTFTGHYHIAFLTLLLTLYEGRSFFRKPLFRHAYLVIFAAVAGYFVFKNCRYDRTYASLNLYFYDTKKEYETLLSVAYPFRSKRSVFVSDESFFWYYILHEKYRGLRFEWHDCDFREQEVCIVEQSENFPHLQNYRLAEKISRYLIYERKPPPGQAPEQ